MTFNYNWILVRGTREDTLAGEESSTYTLGNLDLGAKIKAKVWFQDDGDGIEAVVSDATATVTAAPAGAPTLTMPLHLETIFVDENITTTTAVYTYQATDSDGDTVTYSIPTGTAGGADGSKFSINSSSGVLTFKASPDYENPTDANTDNQYEVIVRATRSHRELGHGGSGDPLRRDVLQGITKNHRPPSEKNLLAHAEPPSRVTSSWCKGIPWGRLTDFSLCP